MNRKRRVLTRRERVELSDGDFLDLDWTIPEPHRRDAPVVLVLHGLEGGLGSGYVQGILSAISEHGWQGCLLNFRGCSGEPNRLARAYHSGDTDDLRTILGRITKQHPDSPIHAVGYSLGGNVLCKYLGEEGANSIIKRAVAVCVPFDLAACTVRLSTGFSRIYQRRLVRSLVGKTLRKFRGPSFRDQKPPVDLSVVESCRDFRTFDHFVTARLHGFESAEDYYEKSSSAQFLSRIKVPTLLIHALDDPFLLPSVVPSEESLSEQVELERTEGGGHVGFVGGTIRPKYWLEDRIPRFFQ